VNLRGDNFRTLPDSEASPILRDWLEFQAWTDDKLSAARVLTAPDRTEAAKAQIAYEKARAKAYAARKAKRGKPDDGAADAMRRLLLGTVRGRP
jgi:hypothetical protein